MRVSRRRNRHGLPPTESGGNKPYAEMTMMKILPQFTNGTLNRLDDGLWTTPDDGSMRSLDRYGKRLVRDPSIIMYGIDLPSCGKPSTRVCRTLRYCERKTSCPGWSIDNGPWTVVDIALDQAIRKRLLTLSPKAVSDRRSQPKISSD